MRARRPLCLLFLLCTLLLAKLIWDRRHSEDLCLPDPRHLPSEEPQRIWRSRSGMTCFHHRKRTYQLNVNAIRATYADLQDHFCSVALGAPRQCLTPKKTGEEKIRELPPTLLLVITSTPEAYARREAVRRTWAREGREGALTVKRLFVMGMPAGCGEAWSAAREENERRGDMVMWDFPESARNGALRERCVIEWLYLYCPELKFVYRGGDHQLVNVPALVSYLSSHPDPLAFIHGNVHAEDDPLLALFSYPPYPSLRAGALLPGWVLPVLYDVTDWMPAFPQAQVYFSFLILAANVSYQHEPRFTAARPRGGGACGYGRLLSAPGPAPEQLQHVWKQLHRAGACPDQGD